LVFREGPTSAIRARSFPGFAAAQAGFRLSNLTPGGWADRGLHRRGAILWTLLITYGLLRDALSARPRERIHWAAKGDDPMS